MRREARKMGVAHKFGCNDCRSSALLSGQRKIPRRRIVERLDRLGNKCSRDGAFISGMGTNRT
jgi:hypothetical protein